MNLRNFDNFLLKEREESNAHKKAVEMGLQYKGFGMWTDPRTDKITHKTEKGELVPASGKTAELAGDGGGALRPDTGREKNLEDLQKGAQQAAGSGIMGAPEPGTEQYPRGGNWNPGPNGDNCVTDQPPPKDLSFDMFVGKTNYVKWVAGPNGSNYQNVDYRKITDDQGESVTESVLEEEPAPRSEMGQPSPGNQSGMTNSDKLKQQGFQHQGFNNYVRGDGTSAKIIRGEIIYYNMNGEVSSEDGGGLSVMGAKPTWTRPDDGQSMTPPAQPETPDEIASVPDPVPAQPPMGYDKFMNDKAVESRRNEEINIQVMEKQAEIEKVYAQHPISNAFKIRIDNLISDASQSSDPQEKLFAANLMDIQAEYADTFNDIISNIEDDETQTKMLAALSKSATKEAMTRTTGIEESTGMSFESFLSEAPEVPRKFVKRGTNPQIKGQPNLNDTISSVQSPQTNNHPLIKNLDPQLQTTAGTAMAAAAQRRSQQPQQTQQPPTPSPQPTRPQVQQPTLQQADTNNDGEVDLEEMRSAAMSAYQNWQTKKKTADTRMSENFEPMMQALNRPGVNPELRNRVMQTMMMALKYKGRDNEASSSINKAEFKALNENKDRNIRAYSGEGGDGSTYNLDSIREFQKQIQSQDLGDDFDEITDTALNALPPSLQKVFGGGDMSPKQGFRKYLRQHGKGGYTGLNLDPDTMQMEHFIDYSQAQALQKKAKDEKRDMSSEEQELYDFITGEENQFWARQGPNETKSSQNLKDFYEKNVDPLGKMGDDFFDFKEMKLDPARLKLKGKEKDFISNIFERDDDGNAYLPEMDENGFGALRESLDKIYSTEKDDLSKALRESFDKKNLMGLSPKKFQAAIDDANNKDVSEDDRSTYDMLQQLKTKLNGYNHDFSRRFLEGLGLSSHFQQSERARSTPISPAFYKALAPKFVGKSREEQKQLKEKLSEIITGANSAANSLRGQGLGDRGIREGLYKNLLSRLGEEGIFTDDDYNNDKALLKLKSKFLKEDMNMMDIDKDGNFDMEDIIEIVKELLTKIK